MSYPDLAPSVAEPYGGGGGGTISLFDSQSVTVHYAGVADGQPDGSGTTTLVWVGRLDSIPTAVTRWCGRNGTSGVDGGYSLGTNASGQVRGVVVNAAGTAIVTPLYTVLSSDLGKDHLFALVIGTNVARLFHGENGDVVEVGSGTACVGYAALDPDTRFAIGCCYTGAGAAAQGAADVAVCGVSVVEDAALAKADLATLYARVRAANDLPDHGIGNTRYLWTVAANLGLASPWTDSISGIALTRVGAGGVLVQEPASWR